MKQIFADLIATKIFLTLQFIGLKKSLLNRKKIYSISTCCVYSFLFFADYILKKNLCWVCTLTPLSSSCNSKWENSLLSVPFITYDEWRAQSEKGKEKVHFIIKKKLAEKKLIIVVQSWWKSLHESKKQNFREWKIYTSYFTLK